jgi:hypothetical protein
VVVLQPQPRAVESGDVAVFRTAFKGSPHAVVQWQASSDSGRTFTDLTDGPAVQGATTGLLTVTAQATDNGRRYRAVFSNSRGITRTLAAAITVGTAPAVNLSSTDVTVTAGRRPVFTAAASGFPAPKVQWEASKDGGVTWAALKGATLPKLTLRAATGALDGNRYRAVFANAISSTVSIVATLTVERRTGRGQTTRAPGSRDRFHGHVHGGRQEQPGGERSLASKHGQRQDLRRPRRQPRRAGLGHGNAEPRRASH